MGFRKTAGGLLGAVIVLFGALVSAPVPAQQQPGSIIANARRIVTANGVERLEKVRIGGIEQWVSIRGAAS